MQCTTCLKAVIQGDKIFCNGNGKAIGLVDVTDRKSTCGLYKTDKPQEDPKPVVESRAIATPPKQKEVNYTVKELKVIADERGLKYPTKATKKQLKELLNGS